MARQVVSTITKVGVVLFVIGLAAYLTSCKKDDGRSTIPSYEKAKEDVIKKGNLLDPPVEKVPGVQPGKAVGVNKDEAAKIGGVILDDQSMKYYLEVRSERNKLRKQLKAEVIRRRTERIITDATIKYLRKAAERGWWEQNSGKILFTAGATVGMAIVIGVLYALTKGQGAATTNPMVLQPIR